jgi:predicted nucleic-acid-binding protein
MRAVDTNVLVRLITRDDARQAATADAFVEKGAWISVLALAEATWVLATVYELNAASLITAVEMLLNHKDLTLQDSDAVAAALDLFRSRPALGFSGCLMLHLARKAGHLPLGTFDRGLGGGAGGAACLLLRPTAPTRHAAASPRSKPARDRG